MLRLQRLRRPCIFGACYLELFLYTCQHTSFSEVIPDLLQELKVAFLLSGFDLKLHFFFFFDLHHFHSPSLQISICHHLLQQEKDLFHLQHCCDKEKDLRGIRVIHQHHKGIKRAILCRDLLESSQSPTMHPATTARTVTCILRCPTIRQTWTL